MARSPGISQALARSPGLFVSTALTCMVGALLPPLPGLTLFLGGLALTVVLCAGCLERPAVRLLGHARGLSEAETAALAPAIALLCQKGLGPPTVELYARNGEVGISVGAAGRRSVVVSAGLLQAAQLGQLPADQAAGVLAAAVGRIRLGQTRFDIAFEFWTIPWQLVRAVCLAIAKTVGFPLTRFAWRIRFVVGAVAVAQSVADGRIAGGVLVAMFIALTYLAPRWQRQWNVRSQDESDRFVADHGLGDSLGKFLRRCPHEPRTLERIHHLTSPVVRPSLALVVSHPTPTGRGRCPSLRRSYVPPDRTGPRGLPVQASASRQNSMAHDIPAQSLAATIRSPSPSAWTTAATLPGHTCPMTDEPHELLTTNRSVENAAVKFVLAYELEHGREASDTRGRGAAADLESDDGRLIEVKAYGRSARGTDLWLESRQFDEARSNPAFHVYVVENVRQGDPAGLRLIDLHGDVLARLLQRARPQSYVTVPFPVAVYDAANANARTQEGPRSAVS
jgi:hypothetical protein